MRGNYELPLSEADNLILSFFEGDIESSELFIEIAVHMIEAAPDSLIRYNASIIGVAKPGERYRFYASKKDGVYSVKYKHEQEARLFVMDKKEEFLLCNTECNKYFDEHPELMISEKHRNVDQTPRIKEKSRTAPIYSKETVDKDEVKKQWSLVLALSETAMDAEKQDVETTILQSYYEEVVALLTNFAKSVLPERESDIVLYRILSNDSFTLQTIGDKHGISRERVRQLETKKWRTITNGFHRSSRAVFAPWRKDLCSILLNINVSHYIQAMAYFLKENARVGEFLIQVSTPTYRPEAYQTAISQYSFKRKLEVKSGERIPQDIVDQVRKLEIVPFIKSRQELIPWGENYKGTCLKCSGKSIVVYPKDNSYYCYSCKKGGNIITYIREHDGLSYREAVLKLAEIHHIGETDTFVARPIVMKEAALFYHEQLKTNYKNRKAIDVIHSWGISGKTVVKLGLGFNDDSYDKRKIYMSATLADDSSFVTGLNVSPDDIIKIISPEKANDIGDRLILFPQVMNKKITDDDIKRKLHELSLEHNVVVIVPSYYRAEYWRDVSDAELSSLNLLDGIRRLKNEHVGLVVLINKYDGIDLPDDACRILVIDGLPNMRSWYDSYEQNATPSNKRLCSEQIQKIEQGMGRGVRSNTDYCSVVLMGRRLADVLYTSSGYDYFSQATKAQFELSEQLWEQLDGDCTIDDIMELTEYSISRNRDWISISKECLSEISYPTTPCFDSCAVAERNAFEYAVRLDYSNAIKMLQNESNRTSDNALRGLIKQKIAKYINFINPEEAQQILLSAHTNNMLLLNPIQGIQYQKTQNTIAQSQFLMQVVNERKLTGNNYIIKVNSLLEKLVFQPDTYKQFESALKDISFLIGIPSYRPEDECGKGPDNFWDVGNSEFFVIECKNGTITDKINKHDCNQLNGSINWFESLYAMSSCVCYPMMIHNSSVFEYACSPSPNVKIMTPDLLESLKRNIENFATNLILPENWGNIAEIDRLLRQFNLCGKNIYDKYTKAFTISNK